MALINLITKEAITEESYLTSGEYILYQKIEKLEKLILKIIKEQNNE